MKLVRYPESLVNAETAVGLLMTHVHVTPDAIVAKVALVAFVAFVALFTVIVSGTCASVTDPVTSAKPYDGLVADLAQA